MAEQEEYEGGEDEQDGWYYWYEGEDEELGEEEGVLRPVLE